MVNWHQYLESLCKEYAQWWQVYTITDVVGRRRVEVEPLPLLFDFGLMVQKVQDREEKGKEEKVERLGVLEGLRKYASDHVLLVGRPGSGKSTALARLLLEGAEKNLTPQPPSLRRKGEQISPLLVAGAKVRKGLGERSTKIPVLVELRYYRTSIIDLIQGFLQRHDPDLTVDAETLKTWLRQGELLLLVDGLNELPSEEARRDLQKFRQNFQKTTPMIFTTRDLGVGGDLDITKKLEMQPLSEPQMQQFVRAYLPQQGEEMLRQLGSRLREFGQTPLLLMMLCSVFVDNSNRIPSNLGSVFRRFTEIYESRLKQDVPVSDQFRDWCPRLLEHLAWVMTCGEAATQLKVAIPKRQAQEVLREFLQDKVPYPEQCTFSWLKDLLKHHLIQVGAGDQIEFRHQLIQEYYTAESLLKLLPKLSDEELKREYLNYLKWTEPLALMLELVEDEAQAVRVVKLALEVDLRLGARLAGAVKAKFQKKTISMIAGQEIPEWFRLFLLGETKSPKAADELMKTIKHPDSSIRSKSIWASKQLFCEAAMPVIFRGIEDSEPNVRETAIRVIEELGSEQAVPLLTQILTKDPIASVREAAARALRKLDSEAAILALLRATQDTNHNVSVMAIHYLEEMSREIVIPVLTKALKNIDASLRQGAAKLLGKIGDERIIPNLFEAQLDLNTYVHHEASSALDTVRKRATTKESDVKKHQEVQRKQQIKMSLGYLNSEEPVVRGNGILDLASLLDKEVAVPLVTKALDDPHHYVRGHAITSLVRLIGKKAVPLAVRALKDPHYDVRNLAAQALTGLGQNLPDSLDISEETVSKLIQILNEDQDTDVRRITVTTLTNLCSIQPSLILREDLESAFLNASHTSDNFLRSTAATGLGKFSSERVSSRLVQMVGDSDFSVALSATEALKNMPFLITAKHLPALIELNLASTESWALEAIFTIQNRCKFYNYNLTQPILTTNTRLMHILHLSDLHFGTPENATLWSNQLAEDLRNDINIPHLDALILSGDIANYSYSEEYQAAAQFLDNLRQDFPLNPEQIILVPGNHDISWKLAKQAYKLIDRNDYDGELKDGNYIKVDESVIRVRDEEKYQQRFANFSQFYETIKGEPYPLDYDQQATLDHLPEQNLLILGLNSAWQLDHHYTTRASINTNALSNALTQIRRNPDYKNCLKIAVWHHPLNSAWEDRITDQGFLEQLAVNGFRFFLHGHIHKAETSLFRYDMSSNGRKIDRICAGTFGAPVREWVPGYPLQYNLLKIADNNLTVYTRRREELNGAWKPDARWLQGAGKTPLDYYAIAL